MRGRSTKRLKAKPGRKDANEREEHAGGKDRAKEPEGPARRACPTRHDPCVTNDDICGVSSWHAEGMQPAVMGPLRGFWWRVEGRGLSGPRV